MSADLRARLEERTQALRAAISAEAPAGEDATFDIGFERARTELDKLASVDAIVPDWELIVKLADELLSSKTKDLRLAAWSTLAKSWVSGFEGLAEGLLVLHALVSGFWDTAYPQKRARARANLYGWLCELLFTCLDPRDVARADGPALQTASELFEQVDGVLRERLGDDLYPGPGRIRTLLRSKLAAIPPPTPPPPVHEDPQQQASSPSAERGPMTMREPNALLPMTTPEQATEALRVASETILEACTLLQTEQPTSAPAYEVRRLASRIRLGPRVSVAPPADGVVTRVESLVASGEYAKAVLEAEAALDHSPRSLDLYRAELAALERLGPSYEAVRVVVERELRAILAADPQALERRFEDGAPAADPATRVWADGLRRRGASPDALLLEHDADVSARLQWAHGMLQDGRGPEAIALALGLSRRAPDGRGRYLGMLAIASAALAAKQGALVAPVLEDLRADVERHRLEEWEPRLCIPLYAVLLACVRDGVLSISASESELYARLYRLDPVEALRQARK